MPELPEVETIRLGLDPHVRGRRITGARVLRDRAVRRQPGGEAEFADRLVGRTITGTGRRGKFLWLSLDDESTLLIHLGMSGQLIIPGPDTPPSPHVRAVVELDGRTLQFRDQRTFGWVWACDADADSVPVPAAHIARDLMDPLVDPVALAHVIRRRSSGIKRVLLNQEVVSGIGNIYADEMLWAARVHGETPADEVSVRTLAKLLRAGREVMGRAIEVGGTSFDALYVNVNGESGYFARDLEAYGREGEPCGRCGAPIVRATFMNRSSFFCPRCQRLPRKAA
ncbi:bifunctional DNA-formamidopyrimidine glycosylase/DNA-(apurinic or apyrimidinic site) lyase [Corynebacterium freneyi]|uniref:bifunctional DNA-formamidopyrimidine glycosylase/DNA-(apurinic or apyrimidinic site) lyase n=1 Tax=Corynebacterium freneyi TaxID=134034 RepID=UPI00254F8316|nr:bifunctional DNA-formamidopyrimidine glycosylase/DNA-(apurinic or apyrimidinic site) lyase [Corynebacterium freneyi]MDK8767195.1 bifunctional DNA-formamidopyrimidine glycosylase/DNA-(apurinic or apyrimidinic site) lyase [Corynebacterium freneyi]